MTKNRLLIDTNILVDHLRGNYQTYEFLENKMVNSICFISNCNHISLNHAAFSSRIPEISYLTVEE